MPGLVPGIHVLRTCSKRRRGWPGQAWPSAAMTSDLNAQFSQHSSARQQNPPASLAIHEEGDVMERRHFLKLAFAAGAAALAASAQAAPLAPHPLLEDGTPTPHPDTHPAVTTSDEVDHLKPEEVRWGRHWHRRWHRRHWGWRRRHWGWRRRHRGWHRWHRRRWGWHRRWRRRYW